MVDTNKIFEQILGKGGELAGRAGVSEPAVERVKTYARENPLLVGGLAGLLLGSAGKDMARLGGLAVVGGLAYKAYRNWQAQQQGGTAAPETSIKVLQPPSDSPFATGTQKSGTLSEALIVAMIAAAKADGQIDEEERERIDERLSQGDFSADEIAFLNREFDAPVDIDRIVKAATTKEAAVELYTVSVLAARPDTAAEKGYLAMLAARLGLEPELARSIEGTVKDAAH
jgi:uncharacterized membrane protein YebE (DUF533 family)